MMPKIKIGRFVWLFSFLVAIASPRLANSQILSNDSIDIYPGSKIKVWVINNGQISVKLDSFYIRFISGKIGSEFYFRTTSRGETNGGPMHEYSLRTEGNIQTPSNLREPYQKEILIPRRDSIYLDMFMYGNCMKCLSAGSNQSDYSISVTFMFTGGKSQDLKINGYFISGGTRLKSKGVMKIKQIINTLFRIDGKNIQS